MDSGSIVLGDLGDPAPEIAGVSDVPLDQGGHVKVSWHGSYLDADPVYPVEAYWVWRSVPEAVALAAIRRGATLVDENAAPALAIERAKLILRSTGTAAATTSGASTRPAYAPPSPQHRGSPVRLTGAEAGFTGQLHGSTRRDPRLRCVSQSRPVLFSRSQAPTVAGLSET